MKQTSDVRKPYGGSTRSLVIALDVGTTFSGVSYAIMEPGEVPKIHGVTRFPGQEHVAGNCKIPSILYYDQNGTVMAAGAEAEAASIVSQAEDDYWIKAELFKLRLRPKAMRLDMNGMRLSSLPRHKTPVDVFGDFLHYLFRCTKGFIVDTHANGETLWRAVEHGIEFVLSHPNGWEGAQQTKMRRAAIYGGLVPDTDEGRARIRFVTEGEASLHACVQSGLAADVLSNPSRHGFLVADAGGGTLDISSYAVRGTQPLVIEEIAPPDCIFAGSVFVSRRAREFFAEKLKNSKYGTSDAIEHITKRFDETTKRLFRDKNEIQWVPFGSPLDKDLSVGIRGGSLKLTGAEVAELFEPSVQAAVASIKAQVEASQGMIKSVWLVGGFAASPWLFSQLQERLAPLNIRVSRPDSQTSKAVADGALGFYCDHHVSARVSRFMYGVEYLREFDPNDSEHVSRKERLCELPSGPRLLPDAFDCILARGVKVKESTVFTRKYCTELTNLSTLSVFEVEIWCYRGGDVIPLWIHRQAEDFSTLCVVRADLSPLSGSAEPKQGKNGKTYWTIVFSVEIHFGLTEFKARIKWNDNGRTKYGPASIVYSESGHRADEDEQDSYSEDDLGPSRSVSRAQSRPASVAPSRTHSRESMGSGAKTPLGGARQEQTFIDIPNRSRTTSTSQATAPSKGLALSSVAALSSASVYSERTREIEVERTVTSTSRVSSSVTHVERDRKVSSSATKVATNLSSADEKRGRESEKVKVKEKERQERERREREKELEREREREREQRERDEKERKERERAQKEREEMERMERELREVEREQRERQEWERQEREREQREKEEREKKEREKTKLKPPKGTSKHNSPIDLADSVVGKSPGRLADTLTSVWGSQSKAVTPAASPWPSARSVDPITPKTELPPTESRKLTPRNAEAKLSTPATPALGEANQSLPVLMGGEEPSKRLSVQLPRLQDLAGAEAPGQTPADTLPPDQLPTGAVSQEAAENIQGFEQAIEPSGGNAEQGDEALFGQTSDGMFGGWGNIGNFVSNSMTNTTSTTTEGWTDLAAQANQGAPAAETISAKSSPSLGWGISGIKSATKNKWGIGTTSFGTGFGGSLAGFGFLGSNDHSHREETLASEALDGDVGDFPLENVNSNNILLGGDQPAATEPAGEHVGGNETGAENSAAPPAEGLANPVVDLLEQPSVTVPESQAESGEPSAKTGDKGAEEAGEEAGEDGQPGGDEEPAAEDEETGGNKKKKGKGGGQIKQTKSGGGGGGGGGGTGGGKSKKKKK